MQKFIMQPNGRVFKKPLLEKNETSITIEVHLYHE